MGGNVFKGKTKPIKKENIKPTLEKYFKELKEIFPYVEPEYFTFLGSTGKKEISGDIDLGIDASHFTIDKWNLEPDVINKYFYAFKKRARTATDEELMIRAILKGIVEKINEYSENIYCNEKKITSGSIFSLYPQSGEEGIGVQIDWLVGNLEWLKFSYYSKNYSGNIKGLHRTQLMLSIFNYHGLSYNHTKGVINLKTKTVVANTPDKALKILSKILKKDITIETVNDYYELLSFIPEEDKQGILDIYYRILDKTRCDIPFNLQENWKERKEHLCLTGKFLPENSKLKTGE